MTFRVVTHRSWIAALFAAKDGVQDFGLDIEPGTALTDLWWAPGAWVARAAASGVSLPLLSCGQRWMDHPEHRLRASWVGREVRVMPARTAATAINNWSSSHVHVKLPEVKDDDFPAQVLEAAEATEWVAALAPDQLVQISDPVHFDVEARFFIAHHQVRAQSLYRSGNLWWSDDDFAEGSVWARSVLPVMAELAHEVAAYSVSPPGYSLDVGILRESGAAVIIEANAAWSSNPYDAQISGVYESLVAAHDFTGKQKQWVFDTGQFPGPTHPLRVRR